MLTGKWHFRTIGMGTINYRAAAKRLAKEVFTTGLFDSSIGHDENFLKKELPDFWINHKRVLKARIHGFGWWVWKPEYIRMSLSKIPSGDGLLYLDAGSFISPDPIDLKLLIEYLNMAMRESIVGSNSQDFLEEDYTSAEILDRLELSNRDRKSNQFYGGFLMLRNNSKANDLVNEWSELICKDNHAFLLPKRSSNDPKEFIHHAHDQAILSCLLKKYSAKSVKIGDKNSNGCIRLVRHKFGHKYLKPSLTSRYFYQAINFISRIKLAIERRFFKNFLSIPSINH